MRKIAIANLKGGVGKSTTTLFLAEHWAMRGLSVLVVDLDPQANSSFMLLSRDGLRQCELAGKTVSHMFDDVLAQTGGSPFRYIERASDLEELHAAGNPGRVSIVPAIPRLWFQQYDFDRDAYIRGRDPLAERIRVIEDFCRAVAGKFDVMIMDCPPGFNSLTRAALRVCDHIVAPTIADPVSVRSLGDFVDIGLVSEMEIDIKKMLSVIVQKYTAVNEQRVMLALLEGTYRLVRPVIPFRTQVTVASQRQFGVKRPYAVKYGRPRFNSLAPHVKGLSDSLYTRIFGQLEEP